MKKQKSIDCELGSLRLVLLFVVALPLWSAVAENESTKRESFASVEVRTDMDRNATAIDPGLRRIGILRPRSAAEIGAANWMIDAATVDRDFIDFEKFKRYLPALGVAKIRLMAGWAKSERRQGEVDVAWLDRIVDWCRANGIEPMLQLCYGNLIYPGAGGEGLQCALPNTPSGLAAWDRWVEFLTEHFRGRIAEWTIWNEPDINLAANPPEAIAAFNVRTAKILRRNLPNCRIHGLALAYNSADLLTQCLKPMGNDVRLFDTFVYHGYVTNPDSSYEKVEALKAVLKKLAPHAILRQGENGCPAEWLDEFALNGHAWSELSQAKWDMRRMLGDLGHGVESVLFTFVDINYNPPTYPRYFCNRKGYLRANESNDVVSVRRAYYAVQNTVSVFDASVRRVRENQRSVCTDRSLSFYEYQTRSRAPLFVFWDHGPMAKPGAKKALDPNAAPGDGVGTREIAFRWNGDRLREPVWVDLMTGWVYELPDSSQVAHRCGIDFIRIPAYDSPCLVAERSDLNMTEIPAK